MPNKTIYIRDAHLPIWEEAQKILGAKSMSSLFTQVLREKVSARDGFLHVLKPDGESNPNQSKFAVIFGAVDILGGSMRPHYCSGRDELKAFLEELNLTDEAIAGIFKEVDATNSSSVRLSLPQNKINLI